MPSHEQRRNVSLARRRSCAKRQTRDVVLGEQRKRRARPAWNVALRNDAWRGDPERCGNVLAHAERRLEERRVGVVPGLAVVRECVHEDIAARHRGLESRD